MSKPRFLFLTGLVVLASLSRLIPHPPNFTPIAALALFAGAEFANKREAFLIPFVALFLSDLFLGLHALIPVVYGSFAVVVGLGFYLRGRATFWRIAGLSIAGAWLFFVLTNLGVWAVSGLYPKTLPGLLDCYIAGIPFFGNTVLSSLLYAGVLFGGLAVMDKRWTPAAEPSVA